MKCMLARWTKHCKLITIISINKPHGLPVTTFHFTSTVNLLYQISDTLYIIWKFNIYYTILTRNRNLQMEMWNGDLQFFPVIHENSIYWKLSAPQNSIWPWSPSLNITPGTPQPSSKFPKLKSIFLSFFHNFKTRCVVQEMRGFERAQGEALELSPILPQAKSNPLVLRNLYKFVPYYVQNWGLQGDVLISIKRQR